MAAFDIFHLIYLISTSAITVLFIIHTVMTHQKVPIRDVTFEDFFRAWCKSHDVKTPIEELKGPLRPYLKSFFVTGKWYARLGITPNKLSVLGLIWAMWALECWFLRGVWPLLGTLFIIFSGTTDSLDGTVAFLTGQESKLGAYYDAVLDKFGDILWIAGPIYYMLAEPRITLSSFWIITVVIIGIISLLLIFIQEYCRARQEGLGLTETKPVIGERVTRVGVVLTYTASIGISNFATILGVSVSANIWVNNYIIPICFFSFLGLAIISLIQINRHAQKHLK